MKEKRKYDTSELGRKKLKGEEKKKERVARAEKSCEKKKMKRGI
jgi:hypothetical protein